MNPATQASTVDTEQVAGFRTSPQQQRLSRFQRAAGGVMLQTVCRVGIKGPLDVEVLERALNELVARHEVLRTQVHPIAMTASSVQVIAAEASIRIRRLAEPNLAEVEPRPAEVRTDGPALSAALEEISPAHHWLLLSMPALLMDASGWVNLVRELGLAYAGEGDAGEEPLQYADLAEWQNQLLESAETAAGREYWSRHEVSGLLGLQLPLERPRSAYRPQSLARVLPAGLAQELENLAARRGWSLRGLLLAVWQVFLFRLGEWPEQVVGVELDGRRRGELAGALGLLARALPVRGLLVAGDGLPDVVARIEAALQELSSWQEYFVPEKVLGSSDAYFPFGFQYVELPRQAAGAVTLAIEHLDACSDRFNLDLVSTHRAGELGLCLRYDAGRLQPGCAHLLSERLVALLGSVARSPEAEIGRLEILPPDERRQVLVAFNQVGSEVPIERSLHQLFRLQAASSPERVALSLEGRRLSYRALDRLSDRLAARLYRQGVRPEVRVGVLAERSLEMVVALLAVLKSGGAYVPLDPEYPRERLAYMIEDAAISLVVTQTEIALPELPGRSLAVNAMWREAGEAELEPPPDLAALDHPAYVIYTSGTTGRPKGVAVPHRAIVNRLDWMTRCFAFSEDDVFLQKTSFSFDAAIWELFVPLLSGRALQLARPGGHRDLAYLTAVMVQEGVTVLQLVPSMLAPILDEPALAEAPLRRVFAGGEALPAVVAARFQSTLDAQLCNLYGPTEAAIDATFWPCCGESDEPVVPIGRPLQNVRVYILDPEMEPLPIGQAGELHIGGIGLARGYLGRPELTASSFVPDPHGPAGERLYRTGDLARHRADGVIEFLGRLDRQLKVRGFRIEPAEIEQALCDHPAVSQAVVVAREESSGQVRLAGYFVPRVGTDPSPAEIRKALSRALPEHLVPAVLVSLRELPRLPNGKLDRARLPEPSASPAGRRKSPRTPVEEVLAAIWGELLQVEEVSADDNFFELGGHSILATQLITRIRAALHVDLPLRELFDRPVLAAQADRIGELIQAGRGEESVPIARAPRTGPLPLSFAQRRLWFLDRLEPLSPVYNLPLAVRLVGPLNHGALAQALREVVRRHEALRTVFPEQDGEPEQRVLPGGGERLPLVDLAALGHAAAEVAGRLADEEALRHFDLAAGPLLRVSLLRLTEADHVALLTLHHIVGDGWSTGILVGEISALYAAFCQDLPSPLPELGIQYADFAVWQQQRLAGKAMTEQLAFWKGYLQGAPTILDLPSDRPRPAVQSSRGGRVSLRWSPEMRDSLRRVCRREAVTPFMVLLAALDGLLYRHTGQDDLLIGTPVANRNQLAIEPLIGFFANTLVLRTQVGGALGFGDLLARIRTSTLSATMHEEVPFERLVEELRPARDLGRSPLFQVMLVLQNLPVTRLESGDLALEPLAGRGGTAKFDLELLLWDDPETGYRGFLEYGADLFDRSTAARLALHYSLLLEAALSSPASQIAALPLLTEGERAQLLREWNDTDLPLAGTTVTALFSRQAVRTPDAVAASAGGATLTYGELHRRSVRLARALVARGAGPETVVALLMARDLDLLVALLAVLEAGASYLPLDPEHPLPRHLQILAQSAASSVLGTREPLAALTAAVEALPHAERPALWDVAALLAKPGAAAGTGATAGPENLAYVIFTSGSTGSPKGAMIEHRGMLNHLLAKVREVQLTSSDVVAQTASQCFDISVWQFLAALVVGGRVEIFADDVAHLPQRLLEELDHRTVTLFETVPSLLRLLLQESESRAGRASLAALRWLIPTGEPLPLDLCRAWAARYPTVPVLNAYGPTECSDDVTHGRVQLTSAGSQIFAPIGRPLPNTRLYVVGPDLEPLALGVPGELWVGGAGVGRGYLNDPVRTALAFAPSPIHGEPGERVYRTGDLARFLAHGELELLGRIDRQVKVRGFRIELGEIEAALRREPGVTAAVAVVREDAPGNPILVAYLIGEGLEGDAVGRIRRRLRAELPAYMVPAQLMVLTALPLTANGKLDYRALPAPGPEATLAPSTPNRRPAEDLLASIWEGLLQTEGIAPSDDFFARGGHSLLATQLVSRIREIFGVEVALREVFEVPRLADLASRIERSLASDRPPAPPLQPVPRDQDLPISFAQQRLWFLDQLEPGSPSYNIFLPLRVEGSLRAAVLERAIREIVARHEVLRTGFSASAGQPVQQILPAVAFRLPVLDLGGLPAGVREAEVRRCVATEAQRPFHLGAPPFLRVTLVALGAREHALLVAMHHIASDGWSIQVLLHELAALYPAFALGHPSPLAPLPIQYADYASWQRRLLTGTVWDDLLRYWSQRLAGLPVLELPFDHPRPAVGDTRGATMSTELPDELAQQLRAAGRESGATLFMVSLAAFALLLYRWTGQADIAIGTDVANRTARETEPLIGFFVNHLVLRIDLSDEPRFRDLLERVRKTAIEAYSHQDMPFDQLVSTLRPERQLGHSPLFQVLFVFNAPADLPEGLPGLTLSPLAVEEPQAKYDLTLFMNEQREGGLSVTWRYKTSLFNESTIRRLEGRFSALMASVAEDLDARPAQLEFLGQAEREIKVENRKAQLSKLDKLKGLKPKTISLPQGELATFSPLRPDSDFTAIAQPSVADLDLVGWASSHRELIEQRLLRHGALLFRGFSLPSVDTFEQFALGLCSELFEEYGDLPRESSKVYHSTPYPADKPILFHNESSHMHQWPLKQFFHCIVAAQERGETPIVDCREVYRRLDPAIIQRFADKKLLYVRNFISGFDVAWQDFFRTHERAAVEAYCSRAGIELAWKGENDLMTRRISPGVCRHPKTGEWTFFNQVQLHHISCLEPEVRESMLSLFGTENLPRNVYFGDGSIIEDSVMEEIGEVYWSSSVAFPWQAGDVLALDNMITAHARNPYVGPRKIVVAMGEMISAAASLGS